MRTRLSAQPNTAPSFTPVRCGVLQRTCACGGSAGFAKDCEGYSNQQLKLERRALGQAKASPVPPVVDEVLRSPGQPLDATTRAFMEPRFGHDFSRVRVHTDERAASSAEAVNALAYTVGNDIVFGAKRYAPTSQEGKSLIAHELTHTIQQSGRAGQTATKMSQPGDAHEQEADRVAQQIEQGGEPVRTSAENDLGRRAVALDSRSESDRLQRQTADEEPQSAGSEEEGLEVGDQMMLLPGWNAATNPAEVVSLEPPSLASAPGISNSAALQRQAGGDSCASPREFRKVTSGQFEGGKTLDDYYPDLVGKGYWDTNNTAGKFDTGSRVGAALQFVGTYFSPCSGDGSQFTFSQSTTIVRARADGKKLMENGKPFEGQTIDDIKRSRRDQSKAPFRQIFDFAVSIPDAISGIPYASLKSYEFQVTSTVTLTGSGGSKSVDWGLNTEAAAGKVTKHELT